MNPLRTFGKENPDVTEKIFEEVGDKGGVFNKIQNSLSDGKNFDKDPESSMSGAS